MKSSLKVAIAGMGVVGAGVYEILQRKDFSNTCGKKIDVVAISARNKNKYRGVNLDKAVEWFDNPLDFLNDEQIDIVVELIGGEDGIAYELCKKALLQKKHFVTANKALIAKHGDELLKIAAENNVCLLFEAAVAGGIPIIKHLREGLVANNFNKISGILNGTCNFILSEMEEKGADFTDILKEAQNKGYAETPPDLDIDGHDTAHKIAILSKVAFGKKFKGEESYIKGIRDIALCDIKYVNELGYKIKLLGISELVDGNISQKTYPALLKKESDLANVNNVLNGINIKADEVGESTITGEGAGRYATASSVVADIIDIAKGGFVTSYRKEDYKTLNIEDEKRAFYLRINVADKAGILSEITSVLSNNDIGVDEVFQRSYEADKVNVIIKTHICLEKDFFHAAEQIASLANVIAAPNIIRIEE